MTIILGIETSCDDTSICIIERDKLSVDSFPRILSLKSFTQEEILKTWGGVVPEIAARNHLQKITPLIKAAFEEAQVKPNEIDAIGVTTTPGLLGPLLTGLNAAKTISLIFEKPIIPINHLYAHLEAIHLTEKVTYPYLGLLISGGHTAFLWTTSPTDFRVIGSTIDDAAGEAFDKVAKMLNLPYPGGPLLDQHAQKGNPEKFTFTHPKVPALNYSFSGLKTSVLYFLKKELKSNPDFINENLNDICASVQKTIVDILLIELKKAIQQTDIKTIALAGGVSANSELRKRFKQLQAEGLKVFIPKFEYCTDNAAMIAIAGYHKFLDKKFTTQNVAPNARMKV